MFKDLRAGTKITILCGTFIIAIGATVYSLIAEKQFAIDFAKKELIGTQYLTAVRGVYADVLAAPPIKASAARPKPSTGEMLARLVTAQRHAGAQLQTAGLARALAEALRSWSNDRGDSPSYSLALEVLAAARRLISRIADDSNLALDPDLDTYHLQDLITRKMPVFLHRLTEVQIWAHQAAAAGTPSNEQWVRFEVSRSELQSVAEQVKGNLASAYRGNQDGTLKQAVYDAFAEMTSRTDAFLESVASGVSEESVGRTAASDPLFGGVAESAVAAWATAQSELDRLLQTRIRGLIDRMGLSLALTGVLVGLSIVVSVLTNRHIVEPLERLEKLASEVRRTRDYSLRLDYSSKSEIGQLTAAFNEMLAEVAASHERERAEHAELARVSRLTTMGAMAASIAHEINQPLQAISANSSAAQRWLSRKEPDIDEARSALKSVASDAHRASQVIESVRSIVKKRSREKEQVAINDAVTDILKLVHGEISKHHITVRTNLPQKLPPVVADRTQLQQVLINLIMNAVDAMKSGSGQKPVLTLRSNLEDRENVTVTVEDSGSGIDPENLERIFDPFFSTKSEGMGLGLAICRSIIEAHGGRLWATSKAGRGAAFHLTLPIGEA